MAKFLKIIDFTLIIPAILLTSIGLLLIFSTSFDTDPSFFVRQIVYVIFSIIIFFLISRFNFNTIVRSAPILYIIILVILAITLFFGDPIRGSTRWLDFSFVTIQGVELAKPVLALALASFISINDPSNFKNLLISIFLIIVPVALVASQPDLSNSFLLLVLWFFIVFIAGLDVYHLIITTLILLVTTPLIWGFILKGYQKSRILTFFNPNIDPQGAGYNIVQALIALGSGQLTGLGFGRGTQSHLEFLPESRTDFIFSVAGEELGFIGLSLIIVLFSFLIFRIFRLASEMKQRNSKIFIFSVGFIIATQFFINAAMNMGIFPVSGVTLPFLSFGGSSILSLFIFLGFVQSAKNTQDMFDTYIAS